MTPSRKKIIDHISRLEGQLASIKTELTKTEPDCAKASATLLSASRSFAGLRELFVESFLMTHFIPSGKKKDETLLAALLSVIKG
jgi:DNA-binding FrmR family transcriptional regulator